MSYCCIPRRSHQSNVWALVSGPQMGLTKKEGIPVQPADAERVRARSVKTHINWRPLVALMTASNAVMTEWGAEQESEGRDDNERLNQQTDS